MLSRLGRFAGTAKSVFTLEALEHRVMMDASFSYTGRDSVLKLPADRLAGTGANSNIMVLDDLNGDGVKEIAASGIANEKDQFGNNRSFGIVRIFDGKTSAVVREFKNNDDPYDTTFGARMVLGGDQDGDGARDLIVSDFGAYLGSYNNTRVFSAKSGLQLSVFSVNNYYYPQTSFVNAGDLDGDGADDLAVSSVFPTQIAGNNVLVRAYSARTGTVLWEATPGSGTNYYYDQRLLGGLSAVGDVTGDGKPDILVGGDDVVRADNLRGAVFLISGANGSVVRTWQVGLANNVAGNRVAFLGDVNGDGIGEFATVTYARGVDALLATVTVYSLNNTNLSTPVWSQDAIPWTEDNGLNPIGFAPAGDFNGDGVTDLGIMSNPSSRQSTFQIRSGTNGALLKEFTGTNVVSDRSRTTGAIYFGSSVAVGDLEGDGFNEILVGAQQAESPREGKPLTNPFITAIPLLQFETPVVTRVNSAGIAFGTVAGKEFVTIGGVVTPVKGIRGVLGTDFLIDRNSLDMSIGGSSVDGPAFVLDRGVRTDLSSITTVNRLSTNPGFVSKPAGTYTMPTAVKLAANARSALVRILRDGTVATTWLLRRNSADSAFELVYVTDGEPAAISPDGLAFAVNGVDDGAGGTGSWTVRFIAAPESTWARTTNAGIDVTALVSSSAFVGVWTAGADIGKPLVAYETGSGSSGRLVTVTLPQVEGNTLTAISIDRKLDILAQYTADSVNHAVLLVRVPSGTSADDTWAPTDLGDVDWLRSPDFHDKSESLSAFGLSPSGRIFAGHDGEAFSLAQRAAVGPAELDPSKELASGAVGQSGTAIVGFNDFGELIYLRRASETEVWTVDELVIPEGATVSGAVVWEDSVALATSAGVLRLVRAADGTWDTRNLTTTIADAESIARSLRLVRQTNGYIVLAGITGANQVVIYGSRDANPGKDTDWAFYALSSAVLNEFGIADPNLQGDLVTYVTPWNGQNIAGLNADGEPVVFWTAPGINGWRFTNLAASQEDPSVARGFERLVVNILPWGGIGLTNADSSLRTVWWAPGLGGRWKFVALSDSVESSARPILVKESIVGYATTWGGQNIAGVDAQGHLWVFWWSPASDKWVAESLQSTVSVLKDRTFTSRLTAYVSGRSIPMAVTAVDTAQHAVTLYFKVGEGWRFTDATEDIEQA